MGDDNGLTEARANRYLREAEGYLELGLLDPALERIAAVESTAYLPYECAVLHGSVLREKEHFAEAIPCFERALHCKVGDIMATMGLGWCQKRVGRVDLSVQAYNEALKKHPAEGILHYNLACYLSLASRPSEALEALTRALRLDANFRRLAHEETDFDALRELPAFKELVALPRRADETSAF